MKVRVTSAALSALYCHSTSVDFDPSVDDDPGDALISSCLTVDRKAIVFSSEQRDRLWRAIADLSDALFHQVYDRNSYDARSDSDASRAIIALGSAVLRAK